MVREKNSFFDDSLFGDSDDSAEEQTRASKSNLIKSQGERDSLNAESQKEESFHSDMFNSGFSFEKLTRYKYIAQVARGGMGVVYKVSDVKLNREVALKVIPVDKENINKEIYFKQEVEVLARLKHPNIVQVFDMGQIQDYYFFTMEYIQGITFGNWVTTNTSLKKILRGFIKVVDAVAYVHTKDIVHRDLKPDNILIKDENEEPVLMDFGIAKDLMSDDTRSKTVGTPYYMSPEQLDSEKNLIDHRSDIFSLGIILYEILTKSKPFSGNEMQVIHKVVKQIPIPPTQKSPYISKDLEAICLKCLEKKPSDRYIDATHLVQDLNNYLNDKPVSAKHYTKIMRLKKWIKRNRITSILVSTILCGTIGFTIFTIHYLQKQAHKEAKLRKDKEISLVESLLSQTQLLLQKCKATLMEGNYTEALITYQDTEELLQKISRQIKTTHEDDSKTVVNKWKILKQIAHDIYVYEILPHPHKILHNSYKEYVPIPGRITQMRFAYTFARKVKKFLYLINN